MHPVGLDILWPFLVVAVVVHTDDVARCVDDLGPHQRWLHVDSYLITVADALDSSLISIHQQLSKD